MVVVNSSGNELRGAHAVKQRTRGRVVGWQPSTCTRRYLAAWLLCAGNTGVSRPEHARCISALRHFHRLIRGYVSLSHSRPAFVSLFPTLCRSPLRELCSTRLRKSRCEKRIGSGLERGPHPDHLPLCLRQVSPWNRPVSCYAG